MRHVAYLLVAISVVHSAAAKDFADLTSTQRRAIRNAVETERSRQEVIGVAVGIVRGGRVVFAEGFGFADRESRRPANADTIFNWASNSKPLMAVLAMKLVQDRKLDLEADVRRYVPEFPRKKHTITVRQLLCHQSGIPHYSNGEVVSSLAGSLTARQVGDPVACIRRFDRSPLIFEPGTKTDYSSHAYVLLSAVVQSAGGVPIAQQIDHVVRRPLKLDSLTVDTDDVGPNWATGYVRRGGLVMRASDYAHAWKHGAGAYKSNVGDFATWLAALLNNEVIGANTTRLMRTRQRLRDGSATTWGLGLTIGSDGAGTKFSHNGSQQETRTRLVGYPATRSGVVVMCNCHFADPGKFTTAVISALSRP